MIRIRPMNRDEVSLGLRLSQQAGWNQTTTDWEHLLGLQPDGAFVAEHDGLPVGTVAARLHGSVAWIAMMLVDQEWRGQGIGRALMTHALRFADDHGTATVRLDATPMGRPLYESLGFIDEYTLVRYGGCPTEKGDSPRTETLVSALIDDVCALDRDAVGFDRGKLIVALADGWAEAARVVVGGDRVEGFLMTRPGVNATQIGPCVATTPEAGAALLADACARQAGRPVFLDVPTGHDAAHELAKSRGLEVRRHLLRMRRLAPITERTAAIWAGAGPELG